MGIRPMDWESWNEVHTLLQLTPCVFHEPTILHTSAHVPTLGLTIADRLSSTVTPELTTTCVPSVSPRGPRLFATLPDRPQLVRGGANAACELVHELAKFLVARYPGV